MILECVGIAFVYAQMTCKQVDAPPVPAARCAPVVEWSQAKQNQIAAELEAAPGSALAALAVEYIGQRDIARACRAAKKRNR